MAIIMVAACGGEAGGTESTTNAQAQTAQASNPGKMFDESVEEDKCALLTPAQVAAATGIAESAIETMPGFCLYEWEGHNIFLSSVRVHDSVERASRYYARHTEDATPEEIQASKQAFKEELEKSDADSGVSGVIVDAMPEDAIIHERWNDIGSEAAWDGNTVTLRYGNVTAVFSGKTYDRTEGEDWVDPEIARAIARSIVSNLDEAG